MCICGTWTTGWKMQSLSIYSTVTGRFEPIKHVICMTCISECLLVNLHCGPLNPLCDSGSHFGRIERPSVPSMLMWPYAFSGTFWLIVLNSRKTQCHMGGSVCCGWAQFRTFMSQIDIPWRLWRMWSEFLYLTFWPLYMLQSFRSDNRILTHYRNCDWP